MCGGTPLQRIGEGDWEIEVDEEERVERRGKGEECTGDGEGRKELCRREI